MGLEVNGASGANTPKKVELKQRSEIQSKINNIFGDNKTKTITRKVNGEDHEIIVGKDQTTGKKVRLDAETGEELVTVETVGKNTYKTKSEFDKMLTDTYGMTSKDFAARGIVVQYEHGQLVFKQLGSGDNVSQGDLKNAIAQHQKDAQAIESVKESIKNDAAGLGEEYDKTPELKPVEIPLGELKDLAVITEEDKKEDIVPPKPQGARKDEPITLNGTIREVVVIGHRRTKPQGVKSTPTPAPTPAPVVSRQRLEKAKTDGTNIGKAFNRTNSKSSFDPAARAIKDLDKDNVMAFMRAYQKEAKASAHDIIGQLTIRGYAVGSKQLGDEAALHLLKMIAQTPQGKNLKYNDQITLQSVIESIEKNGFNTGNSTNARVVLKKLDLSEPKPQGATSPARPPERPKTAAEIENERKYNAALSSGKDFAMTISGTGFTTKLTDEKLAEVSKDLEPRYMRGFLRGYKSARSLNKPMMAVYYTNAASPQAKKDFAFKFIETLQGACGQNGLPVTVNGKEYTLASLKAEIAQKGLTEDLAKIASQMIDKAV